MLEVPLRRFVWVLNPKCLFWLCWASVSGDVHIVDINDKLVPTFGCQLEWNWVWSECSYTLVCHTLDIQILTDTLGFLRQSSFHSQVQMKPIVVPWALGSGCMDHINHLAVLFDHLSNHLWMRNSMFSIYLILNCAALEYHNYSHHPKEQISTDKALESFRSKLKMKWWNILDKIKT